MIDIARFDRRRPPLWDTALEGPRAWAAFARSAAVAPLARLTRVAPVGDGHTVLVLPGFLATDLSTAPLRRFLGQLGYRAHGWRLGRNVGPNGAVLDGLRRTIDRLSRPDGADADLRPMQPMRSMRSISVVGWSLGGVYARALAHELPHVIRQVVSLGSPFDALAAVGLDPDPPPVPSTAVYTRSDGIVDWRSTVQRTTSRSENVEVRGSHCGLGVNAAALYAIADRLAQPADAWAPFRPPAMLRWWYPAPTTYEHARHGERAGQAEHAGHEEAAAWTA